MKKLFYKHKIRKAKEYYYKMASDNLAFLKSFDPINSSFYSVILNHTIALYNKYRGFELEYANIINERCYGKIKPLFRGEAK